MDCSTTAARLESALTDDHQEYFRDRGIDPTYAEYVGFRSVGAEEAAVALGRRAVSSGGILMPYTATDASYCRVRLDDPSDRDGRYMAPAGRPVPIYLPRDMPVDQGALIVVESPTKAAAIAQYGLSVVGLGGTSTTLGDGRALNRSWSAVPLEGRDVYIVFDANRGTNSAVARDEYRLGTALTAAGAVVYVAELDRYAPPEFGPDDVLAACGPNALFEIISNAVPFALDFRAEAAAAVEDLYGDLPWKIGVYLCDPKTRARVRAAVKAYGGRLGELDLALKEAKQQLCTQRGTVSEPHYAVVNGRLAEFTAKGPQALANCELAIVTERTIDDGLNAPRREFAIRATSPGGEVLGEATVRPDHMRDPAWIPTAFGAAVQAHASAPKLMTAIAAHSEARGYQRQRVHTHTGWVMGEDGRWTFLHASGDVHGRAEIVELDTHLRGYVLPDAPQQPELAMRQILEMRRIASPEVSVLMLGAVAAGPLTSLIRPEMALMPFGPSGARKTSLTKVMLSCFGAERMTLGFNATPTAIEGVIFAAKDLLVGVDDYVPDEKGRSDELLSRIVRDAANGQGRARSGADLVNRPERPPRGLLIITGEQFPSHQQSIAARILGARVEPDSVDLEVLSSLQQARDQLPHAMLAFVRWLASRYDALAEEVPDRIRETTHAFNDVGGHSRTATALAQLRVAMEILFDFAVDCGAICESDRTRLCDWAMQALRALGAEQSSTVREQDPVKVFWNALAELITTHTVTVARIDGSPAKDAPPLIGWSDSSVEQLLLLQIPTLAAVRKIAKDAGAPLSLSNSELLRRLVERGHLAEGEDEDHRFTRRKVVGSPLAGRDRKYVLVLTPPERWDDIFGSDTPTSEVESTDRTPRTTIEPPAIAGHEPWGDRGLLVAERGGDRVLFRDSAGAVVCGSNGDCGVLGTLVVAGHDLVATLRCVDVPRPWRLMDTRVQAVLIDGSGHLTDSDHYSLRALAERADLDLDQPVHELVPSLLRRQEREIDKLGLGLARDIESEVIPSTISMMRAGVRVDPAAWRTLCDERTTRADELEDTLRMQIGADLTDPEVVISGLRALGVEASGTSKADLAPYREHEVVGALLELRSLRAFLGDLGPKITNALAGSPDGRVRTTLLPLGTATGRFAAREPNLLGIEGADDVRDCFVADEGHVLISADYRAADLRALAVITRDESLMAAFREGADVHRRTAAAILDLAEDAVTPAGRDLGKVVNFAVAFGCGAGGLVEFAASCGVVLERTRAEDLLHRFEETYAGVARWRAELEREPHAEARSLIGRLRSVPDGDLPARLNAPVQMSTADALKLAIIRVDSELRGLGARLLLPLHDELLVEAPAKVEQEVARVLHDRMVAAMEEVLGGQVPAGVEVRRGRTWGSLRPVRDSKRR